VIYLYLPLLVFVLVLFFKVESWGVRLLLGGIVAGSYYFVSPLVAMVAAVLLTIGILIQSQLPTVSGM
jgi:hypothetical protein